MRIARTPTPLSQKLPALLLACASVPAIAGAGVTLPGFLDFDFSGDGRQTIAFDLANPWVDRVEAVATQPDGKIVVVGWSTNSTSIDGVLTRLLPTGGVDTSFGTNGTIVEALDFGDSNHDFFNAVAIQPDGKIVVVGSVARATGDFDIVVLRYTSSGQRDTTFDGDGMKLILFDLGNGDHDTGDTVAVTAAGHIVIGATVSGSYFGVIRLLFDGSFDAGFDIDGRVTVPLADCQLNAIAVGPYGGPIYLAGTSLVGGSDRIAAVGRLLYNGSLDIGFGGNGFSAQNPNLGGANVDIARAIAIQPDGKPVIGISSTTDGAGNRDFVIVRTNTDGTGDTTFGSPPNNGHVRVPFDLGTSGNTDDYFKSLALQADGRIVVAGTVQTDPNNSVFGFTRLLANGAVDTSFGLGGKMIVSFDVQTDDNDDLAAIALAADGRIVAAGTVDISAANTDTDFGVAVLMNDFIFADGFEWEDTSRWSSSSP